MDCSVPSFPVPHPLPEFTQGHVHCIRDAIQPPHPLSPSSPSGPYLTLNPHLCRLQHTTTSQEVEDFPGEGRILWGCRGLSSPREPRLGVCGCQEGMGEETGERRKGFECRACMQGAGWKDLPRVPAFPRSHGDLASQLTGRLMSTSSQSGLGLEHRSPDSQP